MSMFLRPLLTKVFKLREQKDAETVKPFLEHLEDLRTMLFKMVVTLGLFMMVCFGFRFKLMKLVEQPLQIIPDFNVAMLRTLSPGDSMTTSLSLAFYAGIILAFPLLLYYLADFVLPALTQKEKTLVLPGVAVSFGLFLIGVVLCFNVILPRTLLWLWNDSIHMGMRPDWTVSFYISFATQFVLIFGLTFELPLVVTALVKIGLLDAAILRRTRAYAVVGILVFATIVAPSADPITMGIFAGPMLIGYELCIWIAYAMERSAARKAARSDAPN